MEFISIFSAPQFAAQTEPWLDPVFWCTIIAGLGLFLFGIHSISNVLKKMASKKLSKFINKCSSNRFLGLLTGAGFTAAIQSSSATSSLVIGLVRAGVMTFIQSAAIIIGANIGTTITSFIVSIPIAKYISAIIFIGSLILLLTTRRKWTNFGELFFAIGCIFFGLTIMSDNLKELSHASWFVDLLTGLDKMPWLGLLLGAVLTAALQSSSAVVGVMQGLYLVSAGSISLFGVLPIILGSNIGTTSTAMIACIGGSKESKKVAVFHMFFNVVGALLFMGVTYAAKPFLETVTASTPEVAPMVQIALCHMVFNFGTAIIFLPLLTPITKLINIIFKDKNPTKRTTINVKELDNKVIKQFPSEGIMLAREQVIEMLKYSVEMFKTIGLYLETQQNEDQQFVKDIETSIDSIDRNLNDYLMLADKGELGPDDMITFTRTLKACKDIERIGDYGENLIDFFSPDIDKKIVLKDSSNYDTFVKTNNVAIDLLEQTLNVFVNNDKDNAIVVIQKRREEVNNLDLIINSHFDNASTTNNITNGYIDYVLVDILNSYQRVFSHCSNIAKLFNNDKVYVYTPNEEEHFNKMKDRY